MVYDGSAELEKIWTEGIQPDPQLTVTEWADAYRMLPQVTSDAPGKWRTERTPYLKEIMDCLSYTSHYQRIVFMKSVQLGATELGCNWLGYIIHHSPGPAMVVWPTVDIARRNSRQRIDSLINETPQLAKLVAPVRSRDSHNTVLTKEFRGGVLAMVGANAATALRSMPVRFLFLDEVDAFPLDVDNEGDPISLAEARTRNFLRKKIFLVSTPTITGTSVIEREYLASDQRRYFVPCPYCGEFQILQFRQLKWTQGQAHTAVYECIHCNKSIAEHHKSAMLIEGEWRAQATEPSGLIAGFHLSALYSNLTYGGWGQIATAWEKASDRDNGTAALVKTFRNTFLGESYSEETITPDWKRLLERREQYDIGIVPKGVLLLTAGVDVQKDRLEISIWGWGRRKESWLVEHQILKGDTTRDPVWEQLRSILNHNWVYAHSQYTLSLSRVMIDTGYISQTVYNFVRNTHDPRILAGDGRATGTSLVSTPVPVDISTGGKKMKSGVQIYPIQTSMAKTEFYANLEKLPDLNADGSTNYPAGYVHLPMIHGDYIQQLCAEQLIIKRNTHGFYVRSWEQIQARNEALDCFVYARAAAYIAGLDRFEERHWKELERELTPDIPEELTIVNAEPLAIPTVTLQPNKHRLPPIPQRPLKSRWIN